MIVLNRHHTASVNVKAVCDGIRIKSSAAEKLSVLLEQDSCVVFITKQAWLERLIVKRCSKVAESCAFPPHEQ